jgi:hypothetical protein
MIPEATINATPLDTMPMTTVMWLQTTANRPVAKVRLTVKHARANGRQRRPRKVVMALSNPESPNAIWATACAFCPRVCDGAAVGGTLCASFAAAISPPVGEKNDDKQAEDCGAELSGSGHERRSQN